MRGALGRLLALDLDGERGPVVEPFTLGAETTRTTFPLVTDAGVMKQVVGTLHCGVAGLARRAVQREIDRNTEGVGHGPVMAPGPHLRIASVAGIGQELPWQIGRQRGTIGGSQGRGEHALTFGLDARDPQGTEAGPRRGRSAGHCREAGTARGCGRIPISLFSGKCASTSASLAPERATLRARSTGPMQNAP